MRESSFFILEVKCSTARWKNQNLEYRQHFSKTIVFTLFTTHIYFSSRLAHLPMTLLVTQAGQIYVFL